MLTTALGGCLATFATGAAHGQALPIVAPAGTLIGAPDGVIRGLPTDSIGVKQTGTIVDWQSFNIGTGQTVTISDARVASDGSRMTILNRVTGGILPRTATEITGTLNSDSNIAVYLVNPSGIVFGADAIVNVGGLVASTLAISDADFTAGLYNFAQPGDPAGITVASTAGLTATGLAADQLGQVALIGARIDSAGTIAATGDVALVAASDVTLTYDAANPLGFTVREGTSLGTTTTDGDGPMVVSGTIGGRSALFVAATRQTVNEAVLDIRAAVTATSALATDRGVVLIAGNVPGADAGVTFADDGLGGPSPANSGVVSLALGGAALNQGLTATGAGGAIRLASSGGIGRGSAPSPFASILSASQGIVANALNGDIVLGALSGSSVTVSTDTGNIGLSTADATGGALTLAATGGNLDFGTLTATGVLSGTASGDLTGTSAISTAGALSLAANGGTLSIGSATSFGAMTLGGTTASLIGSATTTDSASDLTVTGGRIAGTTPGTRADLAAGRALSVTVGGSALLGTVGGRTGASVSAASIDATSVATTGGLLSLTATASDLTTGNATGDTVSLIATSGLVKATTVRATGSVTVDGTSTDLGTVDALGSTLSIRTRDALGTMGLIDGFAQTTATLRAAGGTTIGLLEAATIDADAGGRLAATTLQAGTGLTGIGGSVAIGTAVANSGALSLTSRGTGALQLVGGRAGTTTLLDAGGALTLTGTYQGNGLVTARAGDTATLGTLESVAGATAITVGNAASATRLIAATDLGLTASSFTVGSIEARAGTATLTATGTGPGVGAGTDGTLGNSTAIGTDLIVDAANGTASVTGSIAVGRDYIVGGRQVVLGNGTAETQIAAGDVAVTARNGSITGQSLLTVTAAGGGTGSLILDATGGDILFAGDSRLNGGIGRTADVGVRLGTAGGTLQLGIVDARALLSVDAGQTLFSPLTTSGTIDLRGAVTLSGEFRANTSGDILTRSITVLDPGQGVALIAAGGVTVRGRAQAAGDVAITAGNSIAFAASGAATTSVGNVTLVAGDAITGTGVIAAGGRADVRAANALALTSLTSGTSSGAVDRSALAAANSLSIGTAIAGTALSLTARTGTLELGGGSAGTTASLEKAGTTGDLRVTGTLSTGLNLDVVSSTDALFGTLTSSGGTISTTAAGNTTATLLRASAFDTIVTTGLLADVTTFEAGRSVTVAAGDPLNAASAGAIRIGRATATTGALALTAANAASASVAGIVLDDGVAGGAATLRTTGSGNVIATALRTIGGGNVTIDSAGDARLGDVRGSAIGVTAAGSVSGLARGGIATDGRLLTGFDGADLTTGGDVAVIAAQDVQLGNVGGDGVTVVAGGDVAMIGGVTARRLYAVTGRSATLGLNGVPLSQTATGAVDIQTQSGAIIGRSNLVLASDIDGDGGDLILRSGAGIDFLSGSTVAAGGIGRISTVRLRANSGATIRLDVVNARSLVSYDPGFTATTFSHDGPVALGTVTLTDTLGIDTTGPTLTIGSATSDGDIRLTTTGALAATSLTAGGSIVAAGATATIGTALGITGATLRSTGGTLDVTLVGAVAGGVALDATGDLRLGGATARDTIGATATGDITGRAIGSGFGAANLASSGAIVTVATNESLSGAGLIRLGTVTGRNGIAVTGREIVAGTLTSAASGVDITARRNVAGVPAVGITIGAIDAEGDVLVRSGLGVPFVGGTGAISLDTAISRSGRIQLTNLDGGIGGVTNGTRANLTAATAIGIDAVGSALLGSVDAGTDLTVTAGSIDLTGGIARTGALTLAATGGDTRIGTGTAGSTASIVAASLARVGSLTSGTTTTVVAARIDADALMAGTGLTTNSAAASRFGTVTTGVDASLRAGTAMAINEADIGRDLLIAAGGTLDANRLTVAREIGATAGVIDIVDATATAGALRLTATSGDLSLDTGRSGGAALLTATTGLSTIGSLTSGTTTDIRTDRAMIGTIDAGANLSILANGTLVATRLTAATDIAVTAASNAIDEAEATSGTLDVTSTAGALRLDSGRSGRSTTLTALKGLATIGTLVAGDAVTIATDQGAIGTIDAGSDLEVTTSAGLTATRLTAASDIAVTASGMVVDAAEAIAGALRLTSTAGDLRLDSGRSGRSTTLTATSGLITIGTVVAGDAVTIAADRSAIGTIDAGNGLEVTTAGGLTATRLTAASDIDVTASGMTVDAAEAIAGTLRLTSTAGDLRLDSGRSGRSTTLTALNGLATIGTLIAGDAVTIAADRSAIGTIDAGSDLKIATAGMLTATRLTAASSVDVSATGMTIAATEAVRGSLRLVATSSDVMLGSAKAGTTATLIASNGLAGIDALTSGGSTSIGADRVTIGTADVGGSLSVAALGALAAGRLTVGDTIDATASVIGINMVEALRASRLTATTGDLTLGTARSGSITTLDAVNGLANIGGLTSGGTTTIRADRAAIGTIDAGGDLTIGTRGSVVATRLTAGDSVGIDAGSIAVDAVTATRGALLLTAAAGDLTLRETRAGSAATIAAAGGLATIDALTSGGATDIRADRVVIGSVDAGGTLTVVSTTGQRVAQGGATNDILLAAGGAMTIGTLESRGGAIRTTAGNALTAGGVIAAGALAMTGATLDIGSAAARGGSLALTATGGDLSLATGNAGGAAQIVADSGNAGIASLASGGAMTVSARTLAAETLSSGGTMTLAASEALTATTLVAAQAIAAKSGSDMALGTVAAGTSLTATTGRNVSATDLFATAGAATIEAGGTADIIRLRSGAASTIRAAMLTLGEVVAGGPLAVTTSGDARLTTASSGGAATITSGGSIGIGALAAAGDLAFTAGGELAIDTADASGAIRTRSTGATTARSLIAGQALTAAGSTVTIGNATARGGALTLTANGGDLSLANGSASGNVALTATGRAGVAGDLAAGGDYAIDAATVAIGTAATARQAAGGGVTITARNGAISGGAALVLTAGTAGAKLTASADVALAAASTIRTTGGDVTIAAGDAASLGIVSAAGRTIAVSAQDATIGAAMTADTIRLTNIGATGLTRLGDTSADNGAEFDRSGRRFDLSTAEVGRIAANTVVVDSRLRDVRVGALAIGTATGAARFELRTGGRLDVLGRMTATGSSASRQIVLGGDGSAAADGSGGRATTLRIAATQGGGGRLLVGDATLDLRAERIGVGLDTDFLSTLGLTAGGTPLATDQVASRYVAQPSSTLYNPSFTGQPGYTDPVVLTARSLIVRYAQYALFQNTGRAGDTTGAVLGTTPAAPTSGALQLVATGGATPNAFALFGTINGIGSTATSLLGSDAIIVDAAVSRTNSRANGCVIGSAGGGCLSSSIAQATLNVFDTSRSEIFRTADDLSLPFDPLVGTNNEALFSDIGGYVPSTDQACGTADAPCPPVGETK
ncbi:hypothetical protein ASG07_12335 [Sphingomonas sp. Leaf343]|nr:hypothetical protein ASG07_12335 [Sphingomonas sp. Leaf343]